MPAGLDVIRLVNELLGDAEHNDRTAPRQAVLGAASVRDAIESVNLYDGMSEEMALEARAVFDALPPEVDRQILDALRDGLDRDVSITVEWQEHADIHVEVSEVPETSGVHIVLHTPDGREFLS